MGSPSGHPNHRRLTLAEVMILVAATAIGLLPIRLLNNHLHYMCTFWGPVEGLIFRASILATPLLTAWTLVGLGMHLKWPRLSRRQLARSPGFLALLGATVIMLCKIARFALSLRAVAPIDSENLATFLSDFLMKACNLVAPAVLAAWLPLMVAGRWRPTRDWVDRFGCLVGLAWIGLFAIIEGYQIYTILFLR